MVEEWRLAAAALSGGGQSAPMGATNAMERYRNVLTFNNAARQPAWGYVWILAALGGLAACFVIPYFPLSQADTVISQGIAGFIAFIFFLIGAGVLLIRQGVRIDRRRGIVEDWNGLVFYPRKRRTDLRVISDVDLAEMVIHGKHQRHVFYSVALAGPDPQVLITSEADYAKARATAEQVAAFVGVPLRDHV